MPNHKPQASPQPEPLPSEVGPIPTDLDRQAILARLDTAARRGRLPGLVAPSRRGLFEVRDFGHPFESRLVATQHDGSLECRTELIPAMPLVYLAVIVVSVWPGVWLMESFLATLGGSFWRWTWHWYVPLSIISGVWAMGGAWKKSKATAAAEAPAIIEKIAKELAVANPASAGWPTNSATS